MAIEKLLTRTRMLKIEEVMRLTGLRRDSIYRKGRDGTFPRAYKLSERASAWKSDEIQAWIDALPVSGTEAA